MARYEIRISGYGGQGVITLSKMIITAASLHEGYAGTQTEAY
ncbi:pyruvate ferredoxin oxidoreductase, partial [Methanosarcinales archaeon]